MFELWPRFSSPSRKEQEGFWRHRILPYPTLFRPLSKYMCIHRYRFLFAKKHYTNEKQLIQTDLILLCQMPPSVCVCACMCMFATMVPSLVPCHSVHFSFFRLTSSAQTSCWMKGWWPRSQTSVSPGHRPSARRPPWWQRGLWVHGRTWRQRHCGE